MMSHMVVDLVLLPSHRPINIVSIPMISQAVIDS